jgi:hypothetical protein
MVNGHFAPYGPAGGFYVPQGGPVMGGKLTCALIPAETATEVRLRLRLSSSAPGTPNGFPQGLPRKYSLQCAYTDAHRLIMLGHAAFANNPGNQSPMMVANAMLRPTGNPVYYVQPPVMSHRELSTAAAKRQPLTSHSRSCIPTSLPSNSAVRHFQPSRRSPRARWSGS